MPTTQQHHRHVLRVNVCVNLTDDVSHINTTLPLHEAPFTQELGKPSVFRNDALLAS